MSDIVDSQRRQCILKTLRPFVSLKEVRPGLLMPSLLHNITTRIAEKYIVKNGKGDMYCLPYNQQHI
jgi:hypothetical protein